MRKVAQIMGMAISIDIPEAKNEAVFKLAFKRLETIGRQFSPFRTDNELFGYNAGIIKKPSAELAKIIRACKKAEAETDGYFSAWYSGKFEPSGYVKAWAIAEAGKLIEKKGFKTYCIGAGGDIWAKSSGRKTWGIGIENPLALKYLTSQVFLKNGAVTTSGNYQRGQHIINPKTGRPAKALISLSVSGPDIIKADILATAGFAAGQKAIEFVTKHKGYEALAVTSDQKLISSPGWPSHTPESNPK